MNDKLPGILSMIYTETRYVNCNSQESFTKDVDNGTA